MERGSTHFNYRRSVVVVFLGAFLMILRADRSFVHWRMKSEPPGRRGFIRRPHGRRALARRRASARSFSAGLRSNESGRTT